MNTYRSAGLLIGIVVGLIVSVFVIRFFNRNRKLRTEYDEMQKQIRGDGYRIAFYAVLIYEALMCVLTSAVELPVEPIVLHFIPIFFGVTVQAGYCIWKDAYVGLNTNLKRFIICMIVISLVNLIIALMNFREGIMVREGILQAPFVNLLCGIMFAILGVVALVRKAVGRSE